MIDRGAFNIETMLYTRMIKEQAKEKGVDFQFLLGNHEMYFIDSSFEPGYGGRLKCDHFGAGNAHRKYSIEDKLLRSMLVCDINKKRLKVSYADDKSRYLCMHAGLEKNMLLKVVKGAARHYKKVKLLAYIKLLESKGKVASQDVYKAIEEYEMPLPKISEWLNEEFSNFAIKEYVTRGKHKKLLRVMKGIILKMI